ncbi:MAG: mechanosensitive ion channel [Burkholderiales bacterium]|nr:mechanosensitive ion channel [Burkholderiales bacterium]
MKIRFACATAAAALLLVLAGGGFPALAAERETARPAAPGADSLDLDVPTAPVVIDGNVLFRVRGITSFPAAERAAGIAGRIEALAADRGFRAEELRLADVEIGTEIRTDRLRVLLVIDADARLEGLSRKEIATAFRGRIVKAIEEYRAARTPEALAAGATRAGAATLVFALAVALIFWIWRRLNATLEARFRRRIHSVGIQSFQIVRAERIWGTLQSALRGARAVVLLVAAFAYLQYALAQFPTTRVVAGQLLDYVLGPLGILGRGVLGILPNLVFLAILWFVARYALRLIHLFFAAVGRGEVKLSGFEAEWAEPTYKLLRLLVVILALVVAYPYIPGSGSEAFKGLSIFIGVVFSLGSSSAIANMIAGYLMTYRRAFRLGDRVKIQGIVGDVSEMRLQVTHLKTVKNEEVVIPNSTILNNEVVNYSEYARKEGLILHTTVGIGYETPCRQVEAMLLMAAERTAGLKREPAPFVRYEKLGDFAVNYEVNVYCDNAQAMGALYTELHRNILDVFNEYGVQIMTPAYEGDPAQPKIVPKEEWYAAPARGPRDTG